MGFTITIDSFKFGLGEIVLMFTGAFSDGR